MSHVLAFQIPSIQEWLVIAAIGLLFFGKRLPEVGRSLGKGIVEFKKGLKGIEDDIDDQVDTAAKNQEQQRRIAATTTADQAKPRFDPYTGKPIVEPGHKFDPYTGKPIDSEHAEATSNSNGSTQDEPAHQG